MKAIHIYVYGLHFSLAISGLEQGLVGRKGRLMSCSLMYIKIELLKARELVMIDIILTTLRKLKMKLVINC